MLSGTLSPARLDIYKINQQKKLEKSAGLGVRLITTKLLNMYCLLCARYHSRHLGSVSGQSGSGETSRLSYWNNPAVK